VVVAGEAVLQLVQVIVRPEHLDLPVLIWRLDLAAVPLLQEVQMAEVVLLIEAVVVPVVLAVALPHQVVRLAVDLREVVRRAGICGTSRCRFETASQRSSRSNRCG